jgi:acetoacetyl-CoA reductase
MGGLGQCISTKLFSPGYKVVVTYSHDKKNHDIWVDAMKKQGYEFFAYPIDVAGYD